MTVYKKYFFNDTCYPTIEFDDTMHKILINEAEFDHVEEVIVDPNNCVKVWVYDNEYEDMPNYQDDQPLVFANADDYEAWNDANNGDGHSNFNYREVHVKNGIETVIDN